jgi:hypothetical protein
MTNEHNAHQEATISMAKTLTSETCPVGLLNHGKKILLKGIDGSWIVLDDPFEVEEVIREKATQQRVGNDVYVVPNLAVLLSPKNDCQVICLDVDGVNGRVIAKMKELGLSKDDAVWRQRTGKRNGHWHIFYFWPGGPLPRIANKPDGLTIDCLSNGYALVAPSNTYRDPSGGGPYQWVKGHSPEDISLVELERAPDALIEWWMERSHIKTSSDPTEPQGEGSKAFHLLNSPIGQGGRNDTLAKIAGWLRLYHPPAVVESLLLAINDGRCDPPLSEGEVKTIARSISRYPQPGVNGHPRAVVPSFKRAEPVNV